MLRIFGAIGASVAVVCVLLALSGQVRSASDAQDVNILRMGGVAVGAGGILVASFTDRSGSISTGGTAQTLAAINTSRKRIIIENPCSLTSQGIAAAESLFINFTSAAAANSTSVELAPCGSYDSGSGPVTGELISVLGATTAHKWIAKEQ